MSKKISYNKLLILSLFLLFSNIYTNFTLCQFSNWQRVYKNRSIVSRVYGFSSCKADGANLYFLATDYGMIASSVYKVNANGDSLFRKDFDSVGFKIISDDNGGLILTGINNTLRLDSIGNIVWKISNTYYTNEYSDIIKTSTGKYVACGWKTAFMIDINGNKIWSKGYSSPSYKRYYSVIESFDGGFLLGGEVSDGTGLPILGIITKIDSEGNFLWDQRYTINDPQNGLRDMNLMKFSNYYYAGGYYYDAVLEKTQNIILKLDSLGNVLSMKKIIYNPNYNCYAKDYKLLNGNKFLTVGVRYTTNYDSSFSFAFISDTLGSILNLKEYVVGNQNQLQGINIIDSKYVLTGMTNYFYAETNNLYAIKTDSSLEAPPVLVINVSSEVPISYSLSQNYPNPFNPATTIKFGIPKSSFVRIAIYNILGKEVKTLVKENLQAGTYQTIWNSDGVSSGVYFYRIQSGDFVMTKRMVLIK